MFIYIHLLSSICAVQTLFHPSLRLTLNIVNLTLIVNRLQHNNFISIRLTNAVVSILDKAFWFSNHI